MQTNIPSLCQLISRPAAVLLRVAVVMVAVLGLSAACSEKKAILIAELTAEPDLAGPLEIAITLGTVTKRYTVTQSLTASTPVRLGYRVESDVSAPAILFAEAKVGTTCYSASKSITVPSGGGTLSVPLKLAAATNCGSPPSDGGATGSGGASGSSGGSTGTGGSAGSGGTTGTGGRAATGGVAGSSSGGTTVDAGSVDLPPEGPPPPINPPSLASCLDYDHGVITCVPATGAGNWALWSVAFSPDGKLVLSAGEDNRIKFWRVEGRTLVADGRVLSTRGTTPNHIRLAFSPDGKYLAAGNNTGDLRVFDTATWIVYADLPAGHTTRVVGVQFSPDSSKLLSIADDGLRVWSVAAKSMLSAHVLPGEPRSLAVSPVAGATLWTAVGMNNMQLALLDVNAAAPVVRSFPVTSSTNDPSTVGVAFSPDGQMLATGGADGALWLFSAVDKTMISKIGTALVATPFEDVNAVAFFPSGRHVGAAIWGFNTSGQIGVWDTMTRVQRSMVGGTRGPVSIAISPDGGGVVVGNWACAKLTYCHD